MQSQIHQINHSFICSTSPKYQLFFYTLYKQHNLNFFITHLSIVLLPKKRLLNSVYYTDYYIIKKTLTSFHFNSSILMFPTKHKKNTTGCRFGEEYCRQFNNLAYCSTRTPNQRRPKNKVTPILSTTASMRELYKSTPHKPTLALEKIMKKSCEQPKHTGDCISNHVQVNNERYKYGLQILYRHAVLDQVAQDHAQRMTTMATSSDIGTSNKGSIITKKELQENHNAEKGSILPSVPQESRKQMLQVLEEKASANDQGHLQQQQQERNISSCHQNSFVGIGRNVAVGHSVLEIHSQMMFGDSNEKNSFDNQHKNNILNPRFKYFGMGTAKCETSGKLYLCQLFL